MFRIQHEGTEDSGCTVPLILYLKASGRWTLGKETQYPLKKRACVGPKAGLDGF